MNKFFVYCGYTQEEEVYFKPSHKIVEFTNEDELKKFHKEWLKETEGIQCTNLIFRVFLGEEHKFVPKEKVIEYELE